MPPRQRPICYLPSRGAFAWDGQHLQLILGKTSTYCRSVFAKGFRPLHLSLCSFSIPFTYFYSKIPLVLVTDSNRGKTSLHPHLEIRPFSESYTNEGSFCVSIFRVAADYETIAKFVNKSHAPTFVRVPTIDWVASISVEATCKQGRITELFVEWQVVVS